MRRPVLVLVPLVMLLAACRSGAVMWERCDPSGDPTGTDGQFTMVCSDGEWIPVMTVHEWIRVHAGEQVDIAPLPERPAAPPTTPAVTTPPPTTTPPTTTTVTVPPVSAPTILTVSPDSGDVDGGVFVTITGTGFTDTISVTMGGVDMTNMVVVDDTTITLYTLPRGSGPGDVVVTTPAGSATKVNGYLFT
jgi:IPT/TIG domain